MYYEWKKNGISYGLQDYRSNSSWLLKILCNKSIKISWDFPVLSCFFHLGIILCFFYEKLIILLTHGLWFEYFFIFNYKKRHISRGLNCDGMIAIGERIKN